MRASREAIVLTDVGGCHTLCHSNTEKESYLRASVYIDHNKLLFIKRDEL